MIFFKVLDKIVQQSTAVALKLFCIFNFSFKSADRHKVKDKDVHHSCFKKTQRKQDIKKGKNERV